MTHCDKVEEKLSGYLDNELTQQDNQFVTVHIQSCENCQKTYSDLLDMQSEIREIKTDGGEEAALEKIMNDLSSKQSQQWGWVLIIIAAAIVIAVSVFQFIFNNGNSLYENIIIILFGVGGLLLFVSVIKQRIIAAKSDKYKDINL